MSLSHSDSQSLPVSCETQTLLQEYLTSSRLAEIVYRDDAGQIQTTHDAVRELFSRAGRDFLCLGRGQMLRLDHVLTLDGHPVARLPSL